VCLDKNSESLVSIIIVNWNSGNQLFKTVSSIDTYHSNLVSRVIVVDNASNDTSINQLDAIEAHSFQLQIVHNTENRGFAAACNQGATNCKTDYLLFLNPDTRLFEDSLTKSISFMEQPSNTNIGICGIHLVDEIGNSSTCAARFPTLRVMMGKILGISKIFPKTFPEHLMLTSDLRENCVVDQVIGAFFLIRKNVFESCGGFDERFFVYFEEVDLSLRAKQNGYSSCFLADAKAFHKGGGCSGQVKAARLFYSLRSRIIYAQKHYSFTEFVALILLTFLEFPLRLILGLVRVSWSEIKNTLIAYAQLITYFYRRARWS